MDKINAAIFSTIGSLMVFIPALWPSYFASAGSDIVDASALWLIFMGTLQSSFGLFFIFRDVVLPAVAHLATLGLPKSTPVEQPQHGVVLRPMAVGYLNATRPTDRRIAA